MAIKNVYKWELPIADTFELALPKDAEILTIQVQGERACMWALVNPAAKLEARQFRMTGTGHPIHEQEKLKYIATIQIADGSLVFHYFEVL